MGVGKNYSRNRKRVERNKNDFYQTPYCLTEKLLEKESIEPDTIVFDGCCGFGAIGKVLKEHNIPVIEKDIMQGENFFDCEEIYITGIMNPPFCLFNEWVKKCFTVFSHKFCLLSPTTYLQGLTRYNKDGTGVFQNKAYPLARIYTFNRYPMLEKNLRKDGKIKTGMQALSWYVFIKGYKGKTTHDWLNINEFVYRKNKK